MKNLQYSYSKLNFIHPLTDTGIIDKTLIPKKFLPQKQQEYYKLKYTFLISF